MNKLTGPSETTGAEYWRLWTQH